MKLAVIILFASSFLFSCTTKTSEPKKIPIQGTWQLVMGTVIKGNDTTVTDYTKNISFIKIINDTHFAFLQHNVNKNDTATNFSAGGGAYTLSGNTYTEHLDYCSLPAAEGGVFSFAISISADTFIQSGVEKVPQSNISVLNTEKYVRVKP